MIRAVLVDGLTLVRSGVRALLQTAGDIEVVAEGATADDATRLATQHRPDVLLLDQEVTGAVQAIRTVKERMASCEVVVLTNALHQAEAAQVIAAGAGGYVCKDVPAHALISVLRTVCDHPPAHEAGAFTDGAPRIFYFNRAGLRSQPEVNGLTARELDILTELTSGNTDQEIAEKLLVGEGTVKTHIRHILHKLGVRNRTAAIAYALRRRLVE